MTYSQLPYYKVLYSEDAKIKSFFCTYEKKNRNFGGWWIFLKEIPYN